MRRARKGGGAEAPQKCAFVQTQMTQHADKPSFVSKLLLDGQKKRLTPDEEHAIKWTALSLYGGGADTVREPKISRAILDCSTYKDF
jgi:hypothetical protein